MAAAPRVHLINPSDVSFGVAVITPRWLYVLAAATGSRWGDPHIVDETLDPIDPADIAPGDVVGIGIHTGNALRGYEIGRLARERGAWVVFGGIHATLFPGRGARARRARTPSSRATAISSGSASSSDCLAGRPRARLRRRTHRRRSVRVGALGSAAAGPLHVGVGADGARLPEALLVLLGLAHRRPGAAAARRRPRRPARSSSCGGCGFRFIALADDNFYPVTLDDLAQARRRADHDAAARAARRCATSGSS